MPVTRWLLVLLLLLAAPASAASLSELVDRARAGQLDERERDLVRGLLDQTEHAPAAAALMLADAEARVSVPDHCAAAAVLANNAPEGWEAEALVERAKCALRTEDPAGAAALASDALRSASGFRGGAARALLAADLVARARTAVVVLAAQSQATTEEDVSAAERAWHEFSTRAQQAGETADANRARRLLGDLNAFRLNPVRGFPVAETDILGFTGDAGPWLTLAEQAKATTAAPSELNDLGPRGFRDVAWGSSRKTVVSAERRKPVDEDEDRLVYEDALAGRPCGVVYSFRKGRLGEGAYVFKEPYRGADDALDHYRSLKSLLSSKYGAPTGHEEVSWSRDVDGDEDEDDARRGLVDGEASYETEWSFERTRILIKLKRKRGDYKLRVVYTSVEEKRRGEQRRRQRDTERESVDLDKL